MDTTMDRSVLEAKLLPELQQIAQNLGVEGTQKLRKAGLIDAIVAASSNGDGGATNGGAAVTVAETPAPSPQPGDGNGSGTDRDEDRSQERDDRPDGRARDRDESQGPDRNRGRSQNPNQNQPQNQGQNANPGQGGGPGRDGGSDLDRERRRRPSREDRRRQREERRVREEQDREQELETAPSRTGILDVLPEGYGFLRCSGYLPGPEDVYVSLSQVRRHQLRKGDTVAGKIREPKNNEKYPALLQVESVNGMDPEHAAARPVFDKLTPLFPNDRFRLETGPLAVTERIIDMIAPIGKGQRGMVVAPPKAGKTTVLKQIANGIINSSPDTHVIVLLVDERPEEVTDWQRTVKAAEVVYSTFDKPTDQHIQVTELVLERSKRLAELGQDVAIILDSMTRLTRAYNLGMPASGKILTGGIDSAALYPPRRFFGAARNIEEGGSVTIIASAMVETGSRMDDGIFEEFKGTGNMEIRLDRQLAEKRLFPAINVDASSTRKEELLLPPEELALVIRLRRVLHALEPGAALELLIDKLRATKSNELFLKDIAKAPAGN
jgi:transcription termination factor Rho